MQWFCPVWLFSTSISREICSIIVSLKMGKQIVKILRIFLFCLFTTLNSWKISKTPKIREKTTVLSSLTVFNFVFTRKTTKRYFVRKFLFCFDFVLSTKKKASRGQHFSNCIIISQYWLRSISRTFVCKQTFQSKVRSLNLTKKKKVQVVCQIVQGVQVSFG